MYWCAMNRCKLFINLLLNKPPFPVLENEINLQDNDLYINSIMKLIGVTFVTRIMTRKRGILLFYWVIGVLEKQ
jgi:hypothetical protein